MDATLRSLLDEIYAAGQAHDAQQTDRSRRMLNITPDTGEFLRAIAIAGRFTRILELGTSHGYSTLWLADAARSVNGRVTTVDREAWKVRLARANLERARIQGAVDFRREEVADALAEAVAYDLVFLDCGREQYVEWWPALQRSIRPGGLLVVDNATSHEPEVRPLMDLVATTDGWSCVLLRLGNGEFVALRELE